MSRRGENIWKRKDGRWEARYVKDRKNGRAVYGSVYGKTYKEVKEKRSLKNEKVDNKIPKTYKFTMNEVFDLFLKNRKNIVKMSTYAKYQRDINNHLKPYWGEMYLDDVDGIVIENFANHLLSNGNHISGQGLSLKTVKDLLVLFKAVILFANQRGVCATVIPYISTPKIKKSDIQVFSRKEQQTLEEYLYQDTDLIKMGVLLTLYTGIRLGELCALQWKNIDFENKVLHISKTIQRISEGDENHQTRIIFDTPKSDSSIRNIPLFTKLSDYLQKAISTTRKSEDCFILTGNENYIEPRNLYRKYQVYLQECGLPHYTFHCLRHTFATRAIECGIDPKSLSEILGHSNVKITLDRYVHPDFELKKNHMEMLSQIAQF